MITLVALFLVCIALWVTGRILKASVNAKFDKCTENVLSTDHTGADVARMMLDDHGITNVRVIVVEGRWTDRYDVATRTVCLCEETYFGRNLAAVTVAAHECGHAVQHANSDRAREILFGKLRKIGLRK
jgi:Zn-dependent membrane protease YugP